MPASLAMVVGSDELHGERSHPAPRSDHGVPTKRAPVHHARRETPATVHESHLPSRLPLCADHDKGHGGYSEITGKLHDQQEANHSELPE
jgi:hypothetical protein